MLKILVTDDSCAEGEAYAFRVSSETPWDEIRAAIYLLYPTTTCVTMEAEEE